MSFSNFFLLIISSSPPLAHLYLSAPLLWRTAHVFGFRRPSPAEAGSGFRRRALVRAAMTKETFQAFFCLFKGGVEVTLAPPAPFSNPAVILKRFCFFLELIIQIIFFHCQESSQKFSRSTIPETRIQRYRDMA